MPHLFIYHPFYRRLELRLFDMDKVLGMPNPESRDLQIFLYSQRKENYRLSLPRIW
jgi:hypothetical protein